MGGRIDFTKIENPLARHILKSFHAREDFELNTYNGASCIYTTKGLPIKLFNPMWDKASAEVSFYMDVRGSESPETKVPISILYKHVGWDWENVYLGWIESIEAFNTIMQGIGLFGKDED